MYNVGVVQKNYIAGATMFLITFVVIFVALLYFDIMHPGLAFWIAIGSAVALGGS